MGGGTSMISHENRRLASRVGEFTLESPISLQDGLQWARGIKHRNFAHTGRQDQARFAMVVSRKGSDKQLVPDKNSLSAGRMWLASV